MSNHFSTKKKITKLRNTNTLTHLEELCISDVLKKTYLTKENIKSNRENNHS